MPTPYKGELWLIMNYSYSKANGTMLFKELTVSSLRQYELMSLAFMKDSSLRDARFFSMQEKTAWAFRKGSPYIKLFNRQLDQLKQSGVFKQLLSKQVRT